ncbi:Type I HSP40 co-chaperone [Hypoxylon texense]
MSVPFQCLCRLGQSSILSAAKGTSIHTFDLGSGPLHLSSWAHPLTKQDGTSNPQPTSQDGRDLNEQDSEQPPSKKRRLNPDEKPNEEGKANQDETGAVKEAEDANGKKKKKKEKKQKPESRARPAELPFVILLTATEDGSHLVAVTGQDKTLWVFEHDGSGGLKELSHRVMPKRPSSISISADGKNILSADKFGDVYALPLIPPASTEAAADTPTPTPTPTPSSVSATTATSASKPAASRFTVHSKRNLRALEEQERMIANGKVVPKENPKFEHEPVLGHVSMLTALATAGSDGRPYIITGDRDEHIRVSRGALPQAHVVENFCLGHGSFLNALCVPASRPEILLSGGGDDELFLWDWKAGRLIDKADVLGHAKRVVLDTSRVAVSHIYSYGAEGHCYVVVICELVPAIFIFQLQQDTLEHVQTLDLASYPLDAAIVAKTGGSLRLAVAVDSLKYPGTEAEEQRQVTTQSLFLFERDESGQWVRAESVPDVASEDLGLTREELDTILYPVEKLRKTEFEDDAEGGGSARDSVAL